MGQTPSAQYYHQLIQLRATLGEEHPDTLAAWRDYTTALMDEGDDKTAQPELRRLVAACEWAFGPEHPTTRSNRADWALCLKETNLYLLALEQYLLVADYDDGYDVRFAAVGCFIRLGCFEEATYLLHAVVRGYAKTLGGRHDLTRLARGTLVFLLAGVHQKEALVEYGRLWSVDKRSMPRPLGILAETRALLADIAANHPQYVRKTFNPVDTLPVRNPEFFRFVERLNHHEDFYPNPLQKLDPTLEAPTDPSDVPRRRAYCAGLASADRCDEAVDEYFKLIDFVVEKYGLHSDLFTNVMEEFQQCIHAMPGDNTATIERVKELSQLRTEETSRVNSQLDRVRRIRDWPEAVVEAQKQWRIHQDLVGPDAPETLVCGWTYLQCIAMSKNYHPNITGQHIRHILTGWLRVYGCAERQNRARCRRYLEYLAHNGYVEESLALLGPVLRIFGGVTEDYDDSVPFRLQCCQALRNQGWCDAAEQEYRALLEACVATDSEPHSYSYNEGGLVIEIHDGYVDTLYELGQRERAYDETQRMRSLAEETWDHDRVEMLLARVVCARQLLRLGYSAQARRQATILKGTYEVDSYSQERMDRWFRRWSQGDYLAPLGKSDNYKGLVEKYGQLSALMVEKWGNDDPAVIHVRYNFARYLRDVHVDDQAALVQFREAVWASEKLHGAEDPLTLQIRRDYAEMLVLTGSSKQGLVLAAELVAVCQDQWGVRHPMTAAQWASYIYCLHLAGEHQLVIAEAQWVTVLCAYELGYLHPVVLKLWHAAAVAYSTVGPYGEAHNMWFALYNSLDELCHYDSSHWLLAWVENRHAECEQRWHGEEGSA